MSEFAETTSKQNRRFWHALTENPVAIKELRSRMRGRRAFVVLTTYLLLTGAFVGLIYLGFYVNSGSDVSSTRQAGQTIFAVMIGVQTFLVVFIGPSFTAGAITGEKERQTYDLLRTTLLSPRAFVAGKLFSALSYVFLLQFAAIPLLSLAFMLGGVATAELIVSQLMLLVAAITFAMIGLYFSSAMRTTIAASVTTYASALFITLGTPLLSVIALSILSTVFFSGTVPAFLTVLAIYGGLILISTNLPATFIFSDIILREENSLWGFSDTFDGVTLWLFSPWYTYLAVYLLFALYLYWRTVKRVDKIANQ